MNWLTSAKKYTDTYEAQKQHHWTDINEYMPVGSDQVGKKAGILGYGSIGRQIARVSAALGMTMHAYTASPRPTPASRGDTHYVVPGTGERRRLDFRLVAPWKRQGIHPLVSFTGA